MDCFPGDFLAIARLHLIGGLWRARQYGTYNSISKLRAIDRHLPEYAFVMQLVGGLYFCELLLTWIDCNIQSKYTWPFASFKSARIWHDTGTTAVHISCLVHIGRYRYSSYSSTLLFVFFVGLAAVPIATKLMAMPLVSWHHMWHCRGLSESFMALPWMGTATWEPMTWVSMGVHMARHRITRVTPSHYSSEL